MYQTLRNLRQKIVMLKIKLQPYTMNIIFIYNQYFNKMDKLLLNSVDTLGSVVSTYIVGLISLIIIGVSLLIILYRIVKWMSRLDDMMTSLVAQTYIQQQKEKEEAEGNDKNSLISIDDSSEIIEAKDATKVKKDDKNDNGGYYAQIDSSGDYAKIGSSGDAAQIGSTGYAAKIGSSGDAAKIDSSGYAAQIGSSGYAAQIGSTGYAAQIGSSGDAAKIDSSGDAAKIDSTGDYAQIGSTGDYAQIGSTGYAAQIGSSGDAAKIDSSGDAAKIDSTGDYAQIGSSGYAAQIGSSGEHSVVMAAGHNSIAKAKIGSWITLAEWEYNDGVWVPICVKTEQVDGERIKADTFYKLIDGEFKEVDG